MFIVTQAHHNQVHKGLHTLPHTATVSPHLYRRQNQVTLESLPDTQF